MPLYQPIAPHVPGGAPPRLHLQPEDSPFPDRPSLATRRSTSTTGTNATSSTSINVPSYAGSAPRSPGFSIAGSFSTQMTSPPQSPSIPPPAMSLSAPQAKSKKKKSSILGSFFAREPSADAFLQMQHQAQKRIAQDPCRKIPAGMSGVSTAQIPEHVPKVNSRWDGMPGTSQQRNERPLLRSGSFNRSGSSDLSRRRSYYRPPSSSTSSSNVSDFPSRPNTTSQPSDQVLLSEYDLGTSNQLSRRVRPISPVVRSPSFGTTTENKLPEITHLFPANISEPPSISNPSGLPSVSSGSSTGQARPERSPKIFDGDRNLGHTTPKLAVSSGLALRDYSPATASERVLTMPNSKHKGSARLPLPFYQHERLDSPMQTDPGKFVPASREDSDQQASAFLAGEAQPFHLPGEYRDLQAPRSKPVLDVSWTGLAINNPPRPDAPKQDMPRRPNFEKRASTIKAIEICPWEQDEDEQSRSPGLQPQSQPKSARSRSFGLFSKG